MRLGGPIFLNSEEPAVEESKRIVQTGTQQRGWPHWITGTIDNVNNFLECVRSRKTPNANIQVGIEAARASWIGNVALKRGMRVVWDASRGRVAA